MKVLVIGASGFIGNACFKTYSETHRTFGLSSIANSEGTILAGKDFSQAAKFIQEQQPELIINCAGSSNIQQSFSDPVLDHELNTVLVEKILTILKEHSSSTKFINLSSAAVYGNPQNLPVKESDPTLPLSPYGKHKLLSEELLRSYALSYGLQTLSLRIFSAYGPGLKRQFFYDLSNKFLDNPEKIILHGNGKESRDFIYIGDIVKAIDLLVKNYTFKGDVLNLASGEESFIQSTAKQYADVFGYKGLIEFNQEQFKGYPLNWKADISKIKTLGFQTEINLEKGMGLYAEWIRKILKP